MEYYCSGLSQAMNLNKIKYGKLWDGNVKEKKLQQKVKRAWVRACV